MLKKYVQTVRNQTDRSISLTYKQHKCTLIWLHGLGGQAEHYASFFSHSDSVLYHGCKVKLIQAPIRWVTVQKNNISSWYDLRSLNRFTEPPEKVFDLEQLKQSYQKLHFYVKQQIQQLSKQENGVVIPPWKRIFVGGMSQGAAMSLHYGLESPLILGGVIALSGYLLPITKLHNLGKIPSLLVHGNRDAIVKQAEARASYDELLKQSQLTEYKTIRKLDHSVCLQQIDLIKQWIVRIINKQQMA